MRADEVQQLYHATPFAEKTVFGRLGTHEDSVLRNEYACTFVPLCCLSKYGRFSLFIETFCRYFRKHTTDVSFCNLRMDQEVCQVLQSL